MNINLCIYRCRYGILTVGAVFLLVGFIIAGFGSIFFEHILISRLKLSNDSHSYNLWKETVFPLYMKFHFFHWTNPDESLIKKEKPHFVEKGPYVFHEHREKVVLNWNDNGTVTYKTIFKWQFSPELSNGSLSDTITNINVVVAAVSSMAKSKNFLVQKLASLFLDYNEKKPYITRTVKELLYDGYEDKLLKMLKNLEKELHIQVPHERFGWWYNKNMSDNGILNMFTGEVDIDQLGELSALNYYPGVGKYSGKCDKVQGSVGELWPKNNTLRNTVVLFVPDLCGSFALTHSGLKEVYGVEGTSFVGSDDVFDNGTKYESARCYCANMNCEYAAGIRNISACFNATPAFLSYPHFYLADEVYRNEISGMNPDKEKHAFRFTLEQKTGVTMEAYARLQINIMLEPSRHIRMLENVPKVLIPAIWFEQFADMPADFLQNIKFMATTVPTLLQYTGFGLLCFSITFLIVGLLAINKHYFSQIYSNFENEE